MKLRRIPITGWRRCLHEAAAFDSEGEFQAACLLDTADGIEWWLRNDPPVFKIPTPAGDFEPDFLYKRKKSGQTRIGILEIKGEIFWDSEQSAARVKARAACAWVKAVEQSEHPTKWSFALVLDQDAIDAETFDGMLAVARHREF